MSFRNRLRAVMRCVRPRSITSQSAAETIRGSRSCGKMRSVASFAAVDGEGDALVEEREVGLLLAAQQFLGSEARQLLVQPPVRTARPAPCRRTSRRRRPTASSRRTGQPWLVWALEQRRGVTGTEKCAIWRTIGAFTMQRSSRTGSRSTHDGFPRERLLGRRNRFPEAAPPPDAATVPTTRESG